MKQFNLTERLQNKSRKVTTRLGNREVRIICWDRKNNNNRPIITLMIDPDGNEYITFHTENGFVDNEEKYIDKRDLFFADEEEKLSEFEEEILNLLNYATPEGHGAPTIEKTKEYSQKLLNLARRKILKDLPKWKKATEHKDLEKHIAILEDDKVLLSNYLEEGDYYIVLDDLKTLPKEE